MTSIDEKTELEASISRCDRPSHGGHDIVRQRQEDVNFHEQRKVRCVPGFEADRARGIERVRLV
jgi:hypothetical protein